MYSNYIKLNENFRSSVNLDFDLNNKIKVDNYIVTKNLCDVIKNYFLIIDSKDKIRSNLLFGPYGKGKSYLLLIISYLLSADTLDDSYLKLLEKIKEIDLELYDLINQKRSNNRLLTVVITMSNNISFEQNMLLSLTNSLRRFNINDIVLNSMYDVACELLNNWNREYLDNKFNNFYDILVDIKLDFKELSKGLLSYNIDYLNDFKKLYKIITHGLDFNPYINNNIYEIYQEVSKTINLYNFNGLFIIIDEFGLFIEQSLKDNLYQFQNFCEKCNNCESTNMYLTCIMHKELNLYKNYKLYEDEFKKIEGRFNKIKFNRTSDENFNLIASNIINLREINKKIYEQYDDIEFIKNREILAKCFPFNPYTLYALIIISEKIGQNERSLFTFLNDSHEGSLQSFINNNDQGLLTIDYLYDYFHESFISDELYNKLFLRCESLLKYELDLNLAKLIKALFIFLVVNDNVLFKASIKNISHSLDFSTDLVNALINQNMHNNIFRFDDFDHSLTFSQIKSDYLNNLINKYINKLDIDYYDVINKYNEKNYLYSNKYNFEYKMCRYYKNIFINYNTFSNLNDFDTLVDEADGLVINLFNINFAQDLLDIFLKKENINNVIIRFSNYTLTANMIENIKKLSAIENIIEKEVLEVILIEELNIYKKNLIFDLNRFLDKYYLYAKTLENDNLNYLLYDKLVNTYNKTLIFNYEAVNRNHLTKITTKSIFNIIDNNLKNLGMTFSLGSAENSINKAFLKSLNEQHSVDILEVIKKKISDNNLNIIYNILSTKPYKLRIGVILLYIAYYITNISKEKYILTKHDLELELNANNLLDAILDYNYKIKVIKTNDLYHNFRKDISSYLEIDNNNNYQTDTAIVKALQRKVYNLDQIIINSTKDNNILDLDKEQIKFKDLLLKKDLNPYEFLYTKLIKLFKVDLSDLAKKIIKTFNKYNLKLEEYEQNAINKVLNVLDIKELYEYKDKYININYDNLSSKDRLVDELFRTNNKLDNILLNKLSLLLINKSINNYQLNDEDNLLNMLDKYLNNINKMDIKLKEEINISLLGKTLESNLVDTISEYGEAISKEEKIAILENIIRGL